MAYLSLRITIGQLRNFFTLVDVALCRFLDSVLKKKGLA